MSSDVREIVGLLEGAGALRVPVHVMHRSPERVFACFNLEGELEGVVLQGAAPPRQPQILTGPQAKVLRQLDVDGAVPEHQLSARVVTQLASLNLVSRRQRNVVATKRGLRALEVYEETVARRQRQA